LQQPVNIFPTGGADVLTVSIMNDKIDSIDLCIENRYMFLHPSHLDWVWHVTCDTYLGSIANGSFEIDADYEGNVSVCIDRLRENFQGQKIIISSGQPLEFWFNVKGVLKNSESWATKGHVVITQQLPLCIKGLITSTIRKAVPKKDTLLVQEDEHISISKASSSEQPFLVISKQTGAIMSISNADGTKILAENCAVEEIGLYPSYTRAITDNDRGGVELLLGFVLPDNLRFLNPFLYRIYGMLNGYKDLSYSWFWSCHGLMPDDHLDMICKSIKVSKAATAVLIDVDCSIRKNNDSKEIIQQWIKYSVFESGKIKVETHVHPNSCLQSIPSLARVGFEVVLNAKLYNMMYYGRGEVENYCDRKAGTEMGIWKTTVGKNEVDYIVPSENGNKCDCRWVSFQASNGSGVCFVADPEGDSINIGASLNSQAELHRALHTNDVNKRSNGEGPIFAHLDHKMMGVGGDVSWFPAVYPDYVIPPKQDFHYSFWIIPLNEGEDPISSVRNLQSENA
jgi:beta-galactosidase